MLNCQIDNTDDGQLGNRARVPLRVRVQLRKGESLRDISCVNKDVLPSQSCEVLRKSGRS